MITKNVTLTKSTVFIFLGLMFVAVLASAPAEARVKPSKKSAKARVSRSHQAKQHARPAPSKEQRESDRDQRLKRADPGQKVGVIKQNLSTDMSFNDMNLTGKRQSPFGSQVVVEDEKGIPSLVDYRKNFKDRAEATQFGR